MSNFTFPLDSSEPIAILSDSEILKEEFLDFLCSVGAVVGESDSFLGRLSEADKHTWISRSDAELEYLDLATRKAVSQHLRNDPKTCIVLELSNTMESEQIMIEFAIAFAENWSCVVCSFTEDSEVYTVQQLRNDLESEILMQFSLLLNIHVVRKNECR